MANRKITDLPVATFIQDTDTFHITQSGIDKRGTFLFVKEQILIDTQALVDLAEAAQIAAELAAQEAEDAAASVPTKASLGEAQTGAVVNKWMSPDLTHAAMAALGLQSGQFDLDNLRLDGNTISSTNLNGAINLDTNGTGVVSITANTNVTGTLGVTGILNSDNLRLDGNVVSSTNTDGNLDLSPNGIGLVRAFYNSALSLSTASGGINIYDDLGDNPVVFFYQDDLSTLNGSLQFNGFGSAILLSQVHGGDVRLQGEDSVGAVKNLVVADPDGAASSYFAGLLAAATNSGGLSVYDTSGSDPVIYLYRDDGTTRNGYFAAGTTSFDIVNESHGAPFRIRGENAGGVVQNIFVGDPDNVAEVYYAGLLASRSSAFGWDVYDTAGGDAAVRLFQDNGTRNSQIVAGLTGVFIDNEVHGANVTLRSEDLGGVLRNLFVGDPDSTSSNYYAGGIATSTAPTGLNVIHPTADSPRINLNTSGGTNQAYILFDDVNSRLDIKTEQNGDTFRTLGRTTAGNSVAMLTCDPDTDVKLYQAGAEVARTLPAASGGFEVNNTSTGAGFERVLTTSDLGVGGAYTVSLTAADTISDSTTYTATGLSITGLPVGQYNLKVDISWRYISSGSNGMRLKLDSTNVDSFEAGTLVTLNELGDSAAYKTLFGKVGDGFFHTDGTGGSTSDRLLSITGCFTVNAAGGGITVQFSQYTASAFETVVFEKGSNMVITPCDDE